MQENILKTNSWHSKNSQHQASTVLLRMEHRRSIIFRAVHVFRGQYFLCITSDIFPFFITNYGFLHFFTQQG